MEERADFRAPWERKIYITTILFTVIMVGAPVFIIGMGLSLHQYPPVIFGILLLIVFAIGVSLAPRGYRLTSDALRIKRLAPDIIIPMQDIACVTIADGKAIFRGAGRMSASGGAFGIYGRFLGGYFPEFLVYATHDGRMVVVQRKDALPIVISPEHPDLFINRCMELGIPTE